MGERGYVQIPSRPTEARIEELAILCFSTSDAWKLISLDDRVMAKARVAAVYAEIAGDEQSKHYHMAIAQRRA